MPRVILQINIHIFKASLSLGLSWSIVNPNSSQWFITEYVHLNKRFYAWKKVLHSCFNMPGAWGI